MSRADVCGLFAAISGGRARDRFGAAKALCRLSEEEPARLYPHFDDVVRLVRQPNRILQWNGMRVLANLARVDREGRIDAMLEEYLAPVTGAVMIGAAHAIAGGAVIAEAKPYLSAAIARRILRVEHAEYATPECRNVAIGHALRALERLAPLLADRAPLRAFAVRQTRYPRPATRRKAGRMVRVLGKSRAAQA
jgi:hypothetical protein